VGALFTVFMVALTGLPPTAGFTAKFLLFGTVVEHDLAPHPHPGLGIVLVVVAVIFSVVSLFYYLRPVAMMYLARARETEPSDRGEAPVPAGGVYSSILWILGAATILLGLWWGPLQQAADDAAGRMLPPPAARAER
jgi:NADH-quinone oxidoreductase subunit N